MDAGSEISPGTMIDGLRIESLVGVGGMGTVYQAVDTRLDRPVAVKFLTGERNRSVSVERFRREATSVARCCHPGIVQIYGWGEFRDTPYFTMEFVEGQTLGVYISKGRLLRRIHLLCDRGRQADTSTGAGSLSGNSLTHRGISAAGQSRGFSVNGTES